jgi:hypothetical protein
MNCGAAYLIGDFLQMCCNSLLFLAVYNGVAVRKLQSVLCSTYQWMASFADCNSLVGRRGLALFSVFLFQYYPVVGAALCVTLSQIPVFVH